MRFQLFTLPIRFVFLLGLFLLSCNATSAEDQKLIQSFLERYFSTWSAQDMAAYADCFDPGASIHMIDPRESLIVQGVPEFIRGQKEGHLRSPVKMTEVPTAFHITLSKDERLAKAEVNWKLTRGTEIETGVDHFTLKRQGTGWKIVDLTFYEDKPK